MTGRITLDEERQLRARTLRDKWAGEWNSLPTAIERVIADRLERVEQYASRCAMMRVEPSTEGLRRALQGDTP